MHGRCWRLGPVLALALALGLASCTSATGSGPSAGTSAGPVAPAPGAAAPPTTAAAPPPAPVKVRYAIQNASSYMAAFIASDRGYFQQEGLDVELIPFSSTSEMIPSMATDQVEVAGVGTNAAMWNAVARGVILKAVLDGATMRRGRGTIALVIRKPIYDAGRGHALTDLRGLNLSMTPPGIGSTVGCALATALQRVGMSPDDLTISPVPITDQLVALANGAVDGGLLGEPSLAQAIRQETVVKVMGMDEMYPNFTLGVVGFSPGFYAQRPAAKALVRAYIRATRDYDNAVTGRSGEAERVAVDAIFASHTGLSPATVRDVVPVGLNPNGLPNRESVTACYSFFREQGLIPE